MALLSAFALLSPALVVSGAAPLQKLSDFWVVLIFILIFGITALGFAWHLMRSRIVADENGLLIQRMFKSRFFPWDAIEDYELRLSAQEKKCPHQAWMKSGGEWVKLQREGEHFDALLERISQRATESRATKWQVQELREEGE